MSAKAKWELSGSHDWPAYARLFAQSRRIHIPDLMARADAEAAHRALAETTAWNTVINAGAKVIDLSDEIKASLSAEQAEALDRSARHRRRKAINSSSTVSASASRASRTATNSTR